jgi:hypothetical protein
MVHILSRRLSCRGWKLTNVLLFRGEKWAEQHSCKNLPSFLAEGQLYFLTFTSAGVCRDLVGGFISSGLLTKILHEFFMSPMSDIRLFHSIILYPVTLAVFAIK